MKKATIDLSERFKAANEASNENMHQMKARIAEMEASGLQVIRRDDAFCRAVLVTPEIVHAETHGLHHYYPNAVAELYAQWKAQKEQGDAPQTE